MFWRQVARDADGEVGVAKKRRFIAAGGDGDIPIDLSSAGRRQRDAAAEITFAPRKIDAADARQPAAKAVQPRLALRLSATSVGAAVERTASSRRESWPAGAGARAGCSSPRGTSWR
jgi:hypothetical protein